MDVFVISNVGLLGRAKIHGALYAAWMFGDVARLSWALSGMNAVVRAFKYRWQTHGTIVVGRQLYRHNRPFTTKDLPAVVRGADIAGAGRPNGTGGDWIKLVQP